MKIIVCGASGFIGRNLVPALLKEQHVVTVVMHDDAQSKHTFKQPVTQVSWDEFDHTPPEDFDAIINFAGENITQRWTDIAKTKIRESRINTTTRIAKWCVKSQNTQASVRKPHLYNTSAVGIYGSNSGATDFLKDVCEAWESAAQIAVDAQIPVTFMRFAPVLKRGEGMLKKLEPMFKFGLGSVLGNGGQPLSWIHIDDLVKAILFLLNHPEVTGAVDMCAPECVSQKIFAQTLAKTLHRPLIFKIPAPIVKLLFGQMGEEMLLGGQKVYPEKLKQLGFKFIYPDLHSALAHEWQ